MIEPHTEGTLLRVRAQPGARRPGIVGVLGTELKVAVAAPADQGRANAALVELLAKLLAVPKSAVRLERGPTSRSKLLVIAGLNPETVRQRLGL
ncbi:MAG TPA: DUF167 domain-containing protein [Gemmatales bacterium]|nr:DUF167 domain-containing protein [Gemmatales bacterium]